MYLDGYFSDDLVDACVDLYRSWGPEPSPGWVTSVPSHRHPELVADFARRLAAALELPYRSTLESTGVRPEQKTMANSSRQARNVDGALVLRAPVDPGPVLLVDDTADSRWTLTVAAWLLRSNGSGAVHPLVLALA
jgi:ATP-dependent DNA helicase RecQ